MIWLSQNHFWMTVYQDTLLFHHHTYVAHHLDCNRHGGGLLVLLKECLFVKRRLNLESDCELLWLEIFAQHTPVLFGTSLGS